MRNVCSNNERRACKAGLRLCTGDLAPEMHVLDCKKVCFAPLNLVQETILAIMLLKQSING